MEVIYAYESAPLSYAQSIFLAGPTPRSADIVSWRREALLTLQKFGYSGVVFVPEPRDGVWSPDYTGQVEWEEKNLNMADCILFWVPRDMKTMPGLTTNVEWGMWYDSGKVVLGAPGDAQHVKYLRYYAEKWRVPHFETLRQTVSSAMTLAMSAVRSGGECQVPSYIWRLPHFQSWYLAQKNAGNRLDGARVEWTFRFGPDKNKIFLWALHVDMFIASEGRNKTTEVVLGRPDIATIVLYRKRPQLDDSDIVLIREFRSPAATSDGFVWELPGGSSYIPKKSNEQLIIDECGEEVGLVLKPGRVRAHESRQLVATLSAHRAHLFSAEIAENELNMLKSQYGIARGVTEDTERTYVEIMKLGDVRQNARIDWSMLGMILSVMND